VTSPIVDLGLIAQACRPISECLLASSSGQETTSAQLTAALKQLEAARRAPGRIGWAVGLLLDGRATGTRLEQAIEIVVRVAGYDPPAPATRGVPAVPPPTGSRPSLSRRRPAWPPGSIQPMLPGFGS
jgi:hypothetical protein